MTGAKKVEVDIGIGGAARAAGRTPDFVKSGSQFVETAISSFTHLTDSITQGVHGGTEEIFFPQEIIGGCCPLVDGGDYKLAWQAAAEATDTERVHIVWSSHENRVWFLATRSAELASHANTWCPFAAVLPGQPGAEPAPVCYLHVGEEAATLMSVAKDTLQIHRGTIAVIQAKAERIARELDNAKIIQMIPDRIDNLVPVPWVSLSLLEERSRRFLAAIGTFTGLAIICFAFAVWLLCGISTIAMRAHLETAQQHAAESAQRLLQQAMALKASQLRQTTSQFSEVNEGLLQLGGWLKTYEITDGKVHWRAIVPFAVTSDKIAELGGHTVESDPDGYLIEGGK